MEEGPTPGSIPYDLARWAEHFGCGENAVTVTEVGPERYEVEFRWPYMTTTIRADHVKGFPDPHFAEDGVIAGTVESMEFTESIAGVTVKFEGFERIR